jgi:hypothetical protein
MLKTPIVLFVFNRPSFAQLLFSTISIIKPKILYIFADGPRLNNKEDLILCEETRKVFDYINWPCRVEKFYSKSNIGCRESIPRGLNHVFSSEEECIILEDDCIPEISFFQFCENLLEKYRYETKIMTIGGHRSDGPNEFDSFSYFFSKYPSIWGWATWKNRWQKYDLMMSEWLQLRNTSWLSNILSSSEEVSYWHIFFDKMLRGLDTWDYALFFSCWLNQGLSIRPKVNMISNIGFRVDATHTKSPEHLNIFPKSTDIYFPLVHPIKIEIDPEAEKRIEWVNFSGHHVRLLKLVRLEIEKRRFIK